MLGRATTWIALFTVLVGVATLFGISQPVYADTVANFDSDPGWDGSGNHDGSQNFGWSNTNNAGGAAAGEIGGDIIRSPLAWYAQEITPINAANTSLSASGSVVLSGSGNFIMGWFDSTSAGSGGLDWDTTHIIGFRSDDHSLYVYGDKGGGGFASNVTPGGSGPTTFDVAYDHTTGMLTASSGQGNSASRDVSGGLGALTNLDRFGILNLHIPGNDAGANIFVDDLTFTGIVPEPTSIVLMMLGLGLAPFCRAAVARIVVRRKHSDVDK